MKKERNGKPAFLPYFILWWTVWILLCTMVLHRLQLHWINSLVDATVTNLLLALVSFGIIKQNKAYTPDKKNGIYNAGYVLVLTLIVNLLSRWILSCNMLSTPGYDEILAASMPFRFVYSMLMISCMVLLNTVRSYEKNNEDSSFRKEEAEKLLKDAELTRLRQQLQPHFLFNSLNSISALAGSKPAEARKMIQQLSDFLRGTLKKDDQQLVSLEEELRHLQLYLDIEKVRFGHRLHTEIKTDELCKSLLLPSLLLQPVVENAIKFGLYDTTGEVTIAISANCENNLLRIEITNPYDSAGASSKPGTGFGLTSVQRRLYLIYARQDLLEALPGDNIYTTILKIPQLT